LSTTTEREYPINPLISEKEERTQTPKPTLIQPRIANQNTQNLKHRAVKRSFSRYPLTMSVAQPP